MRLIRFEDAPARRSTLGLVSEEGKRIWNSPAAPSDPGSGEPRIRTTTDILRRIKRLSLLFAVVIRGERSLAGVVCHSFSSRGEFASFAATDEQTRTENESTVYLGASFRTILTEKLSLSLRVILSVSFPEVRSSGEVHRADSLHYLRSLEDRRS